MPYRLRFFFDAGAGVCLWAASDDARDRFGYAVPLGALPLPEPLSGPLRTEEARLLDAYDAAFDAGDPAAPPWPDAAAQASFDAAASAWLEEVRGALGDAFCIDDERGDGTGP